jgi:hypothetical protein
MAMFCCIFQVLNGDIVRESFLMAGTDTAIPFQLIVYVSQIFMYVFVCLFIFIGTCVLPPVGSFLRSYLKYVLRVHHLEGVRATVALMEEAFVVSHPFIMESHADDPVDGEPDQAATGGVNSIQVNSIESMHQRLAAAVPDYRLPPKIRTVLQALDELDVTASAPYM